VVNHRGDESSVLAALLLAAALAACAERKEPRRSAEVAVWTGAELGGGPAQSDASTDAPDDADDEELEVEEPRDGKWLYGRNCAGCHGETGDGRGETILQLGQTARSFAEGGFAFGNTPEAIFRTITSGVPGRSVMPAFKGTLSEEERKLVVEHVLTLMPTQPPEKVAGSVMTVGARPLVARGKLPPIAEGKPERPRGLLIGTSEGLTFEYRLDDVRLLGVRLGGFAKREDWGGRGGSYLRPLGQVAYLIQGGDPGPTFTRAGGGEASEAFRARILSSWAREDGAGIRCAVELEEREPLGELEETLRVEATSAGPGFTRRLALRWIGARGEIDVLLSGCGEPAPLVRGSAPGWELGEGPATAPIPADGWIVRRCGETFECLRIRVDGAATLVRDAAANRVRVELSPGDERVVEATLLSLGEWSEERLAELSREIGR
jgi:mono/diheme cytochrome c family protein